LPSATGLAQQPLAQIARAASVLESLSAVDEEHWHFLPVGGFELRLSIDFDSVETRIDARQLTCDYSFHLGAKFAVESSIERQIYHPCLLAVS
jgi:hypothetical protein